mgnify:CR=1 FL=1
MRFEPETSNNITFPLDSTWEHYRLHPVMRPNLSRDSKVVVVGKGMGTRGIDSMSSLLAF